MINIPLSKTYSNDKYTVVVFKLPMHERLNAVVYVNDESKYDTDIATHLHNIYVSQNLTTCESISVIHVKHEQPPMDENGNINYEHIQNVEVHRY